ncbi:MAG: aspartate aminotransferase family protein, partial [Acetobacteraceae bacterium]|nr:aspartate aminotransferase family protein [Acetobacteraceae bacterium]
MNDLAPNDNPTPRPNDLDAFWMPFTNNRGYKATPRMLARAEGMFYFANDGRDI